jgi:hypothetical protein
MALPHLGDPVTGVYPIASGSAQLFTGGVSIQHAGGKLQAGFAFPTLGRPVIATLEGGTLFEKNAVHFDPGGGDIDQFAHVIREALSGRLALAPTGQDGAVVPLTLGAVSPIGAPIRHFDVPPPEMTDRTLYDVALLADAGGWRRVAPHAVYFKRSWDAFGIVHVTDIHVSKRNDRFKQLLDMSDRPEAAARVYNHNNRFRGFVRYANYLHSIGALDVILSTGDQYDYIFEDGDDPVLGGNASFLRSLILGQAPGPDFLDVEELRVPMFMTTGNHDYRRNAYPLIFDVRLGTDGLGRDMKTFRNYHTFNLDQDAARVLERRLHGEPLPPEPFVADRKLPPAAAAEKLAIDADLTAHRQFLSDQTSFVVALGPHRVVMLDSGPDTGVLSSLLDALRQLIGISSEDENTFTAGAPNSEGVSDAELRLVQETLAQAPAGALVIVGIHAPLVNPYNSEYPYFLRETQRPFHPRQVKGLLWRLAPALDPSRPIDSRHPNWFPSNPDGPATFVARRDRNDLLDYGVSRGRADDLVELLAGGSTRAADLVLSGHTHYHNEFRVKRLENGELAFFLDHYTQTPTNYYPARFASEFLPPLEQPKRVEKTYVEVEAGAPPDATPVRVGDADLDFELHVPPYADPLNASTNPRGWWDAHRPLLLQTSALGPKSAIPFLNGFRLFTVRGGVIAISHFVSIARLEAHGYRLSLDEAIAPDRPGPPQLQWLSVSDGGTMPGASISALATGNDITVVVAGTSGEIYACRGGYTKRWGLWQTVSQGSTIPGGPVCAVPVGDKIALFLANAAGGVYTCVGRYGAWRPWQNISEGSTTPGGFVTGVRTGGRFHVFLADPGGGIYCNYGDHDRGWRAWRNVSEGSSTPGAHLAAVEIGGKVTVILADPAGGIYATAGTYESGWGPWKSVSDGATIPGGHVSAVVAGTAIKLFLADANGGIYMVTGTYAAGWGLWTSVSEGSATPGAPVSATVTNGRVRLTLADPGGGVYSSLVPFSGTPGAWRNISEGATRPGGFVPTVSTGDGVTAFVADTGGKMFARLIR